MKTGLKFEPIVDFENDTVIGYEVLFKSEIPNRILFATPNPELDHHVMHMMDDYQRTNDYRQIMFENPNTFFTLNINIESVVKYFRHIDRLADNICLDINSRSFLSNPIIETIIKRHAHRIFLDDYLTGNATYAVLKDIKPKGVKFHSGILNRSNSDIKEQIEISQTCCNTIIFKRIEDIDVLDRVRMLGRYGQGYVFNNMNLTFDGITCEE